MQKIIVLVMSLFVMSSFANIFDYSKKDLKTYISIGGEARMMDVETINRNIFDLNSHSVLLSVDIDEEGKKQIDSLIPFIDITPNTVSQHKRFGDNNELLVPTANVEFGMLYKQLSVGFQFSFGMNNISKSPGGAFTYKSIPYAYKANIVTTNSSVRKHDASFRTMEFDLILGYLLLPQESAINVAPRIKAGFQSLDIMFPGNFGFSWNTTSDGSTDASKGVRPFIIDEREYNSLGYTISPEVEGSLKISDIFQLSASLGYRMSFFNQFKITQDKLTNYLWGDIDNSNHSYYGGLKFTVLIPSFNTKNRGKVNR